LIEVTVSKRTNIKKKGANLFVLIAGLAEVSGITMSGISGTVETLFHWKQKI
jgi:hypothetical protein